MNSSTLRRLAADHAALRTSELPPHYLFPPSEVESQIPDDLTQLSILLTGPQSTPYSQGLWKLYLKIPEDYPKSPPKASFRTRIWHPNVEENSGSVCVDTLKKDWEPKLTLRDVLITISCLLIQPNPDSALNASAGRLLQEDYDSFARQARLMTSIHAGIPRDLVEAVAVARRRGEVPDEMLKHNKSTKAGSRVKNTKLQSTAAKTLPQRLDGSPPASANQTHSTEEITSDNEDDENSASKENDPTLSPTPVPIPSPKRPSLGKRPLTDLPCPTEPEIELAISPSEQNIINNNSIRYPHSASTSTESGLGLQLAESYHHVLNSRSKVLRDPCTTAAANDDNDSGDEGIHRDENERPAKRVCSDEAKENIALDPPTTTLAVVPQTLRSSSMISRIQPSAARKSSAASSGSVSSGSMKAGKARVGLRRL